MLVKPKALVTDAQMRNSLAIIRSLGRNGIEVTGAEDTRFATGFFFRYCKKRIVYPNPYKHPDEFVDCLLRVVRDDHYDVIFPVTDVTATLIGKYKEEFSRYVLVPPPDYKLFMQAMDKAECLKIAQENSIPCPETYLVDNAKELEGLKNEAHFPLVIKPRKSFGSRGFI